MRIIAKAKPIQIRIKSGGEEHFSLDSLRQNLCVQDLWPLIKDKRLSRWLMQLGEVDLAHAIDALSVSQLDVSTYFKIFNVHENYILKKIIFIMVLITHLMQLILLQIIYQIIMYFLRQV